MDINVEKINTNKLPSKRFPKGEVLWLQYVWTEAVSPPVWNSIFQWEKLCGLGA
jgi:hypothetical protein